MIFGRSLLALILIASFTPSQTARKALDLLLAEQYTELRAMFNQQAKGDLSDETLRLKITPVLRQLGKPVSFGEPQAAGATGRHNVKITVRFAAMALDFTFSIDEAGKVAGFRYDPSKEQAPVAVPTEWKPPPYSLSGRFRVQEVTIGEGQWKLPGTLLSPTSDLRGPFPAVVLVAGSGAQDRDETVGLNKPLRDIAEGLASRGIVVLRYDKRARVYQKQVQAIKNLTVRDETIEDAVRAIAFLRTRHEVNPKRVYVVGHSLGGYLGPRIALGDHDLAGLAVMSANYEPLEDLIVHQAESTGTPEPKLSQLRTDAAKVKALHPGQEGGPPVLGAPPSYWIDLRGYNPPAMAKVLHCKVMVLHGQRDFQVTEQDYGLWQSGLRGRENTTFHDYAGLNHFFMPGEGKSTPANIRCLGTWRKWSLSIWGSGF